MSGLRSVWHVAREYASIAEVGGLKDAVRGLAEAAVRAGLAVTVVVPLYGFARERLLAATTPAATFSIALPDLETWRHLQEEPVECRLMERSGVRLILLDSPRYASKRGVYTWTEADEREDPYRRQGSGHWDAHQMNLLLARGALEAAVQLGEPPSVFHCHDGHAAFLPPIMREDPRFTAQFHSTGAVLTIHNAGVGYHQEVWDPGVAATLTGLAPAVIEKGLLEGSADPLLLAAHYAVVNTVSEAYAEELLAESGPGPSGGLGAAYRRAGIRLWGVTNGVDAGAWDPRRPEITGLPCRFDPGTGELEGKRACRLALARRLSWRLAEAQPEIPMFAFVARLTRQKGGEVLYEALCMLTAERTMFLSLVLGTGDPATEAKLRGLQWESDGRVRFVAGYDPSLAMLAYAASDFVLVPSAYEPCGLSDMYGQLLGALPVVHAVGGLRKVRDGETGFSYRDQTPACLAAAVRRCLGLAERDPAALDAMRKRAFRDVREHRSWDRVLKEGYYPLYEAALPVGGAAESPGR